MIFSRWYAFVVVGFWLATMGWLVRDKMLPSLLLGSPPKSQEIVDAYQQDRLVGWKILWREREIGWAISKTTVSDEQVTELRHLVHFRELPLHEIFPVVWQALGGSTTGLKMRLEVETTLFFDPLKRLSSFQTRLRTPGATESLAIVRGTVDKGQIQLVLQSGSFMYTTELPFRNDAILTDSFSPQASLPGLREGQQWTVEIYSPVPLPHQAVSGKPIDVIHAKVEGRDLIVWEGNRRPCWLVVYRNDPAQTVSTHAPPRGRLWVEPSGRVLQQEAKVGDSYLVLVRLGDAQARTLAQRLEKAQAAEEGRSHD
jgi:hypothetical protein